MVQIICMLRCLNDDNFYWPGTDDILQYHMTDVIGVIDPPEANGKFYRGELVFSCSNDTLKMVEEALEEKF